MIFDLRNLIKFQHTNPLELGSIRQQLISAAAICAAFAFAMYAWTAGWVPRQVKDIKTVTIRVQNADPSTYTTKIRTIYLPRGRHRGRSTAREILLPTGTWIDCWKDCKKVFRTAVRINQ